MPVVDRTPLTTRRQALTDAGTACEQAQAALVTATADLARLASTRPADDPAVTAAAEKVTQARQQVVDTRARQDSAQADLHTALTAWLGTDADADIARLESVSPLVLLPVRIETRFVPDSAQLRVRIYPDEIFADAHEPELSAAERNAGRRYWTGGQDSLAAWQLLGQTYPAPRAAWIVRATHPQSPAVPQFDKPAGWSRPVQAPLLPDRFLVVATRGTTTKRAVGAPVLGPLALTVRPDALTTDQVPLGPDGQITLDDAVAWTVDFAKAVEVGMGVTLPLDADDLRLGFDRLLVLGVKSSLDAGTSAEQLAALFDAHHYTRGLAFIPQGAPTSNVPGVPAAYPPPDDNREQSYDVERGKPRNGDIGCAADVLGTVLGLPSDTFAHVEGAEKAEQRPALAMNRALFSATLGYYLDQMMAPLVPAEAVTEISRYFAQWVIPRGTASAVRVGRVPYGFLAVSSLTRWQPDTEATPVTNRMVELLRALRPIWLAAAAQAPHVGRGPDPDQDLLDILAMDASAREVRVRRVVGDTVWLNLARLFNWPTNLWQDYHRDLGTAALGAAGITAASPPRVLGLNFAATSSRYDGPLVDLTPGSETAPLAAQDDYISWIRGATVAQLQQEQLPAALDPGVRQALLYRLLRHSALTEYHWWAGALLAQYPVPVIGLLPADADPGRWREPELVGIAAGTEGRATPWQRLGNQVLLPGGLQIAISALLDGGYDPQLRTYTDVGDFRDALGTLAAQHTAELERLFTETLDATSHRLDAWITSLAHQRLLRLRQRTENTTGCFVGAYSWVENLTPSTGPTATLPDGRTVQTTPGGYVQAPSMTHAATAAVLRNAYLTHVGTTTAAADPSPYAVDLSSAQVRRGRFVLDSVRNGQPVGAVLGYLVERGLHEQHAKSLIDPLRQIAPLVANKIEDSGKPAETVAARNVVDGLALRTKWKANQLFGVPGGLPAAVAHRDVLEQQLRQLDRAVDAVADLLLADSVHQVVRGSTMAAGAGMDALAQGTRPPDPEVARATTGGTSLTHRLAISLGASAPAPTPGWPAARTPRAACEPRVDAWAATLLGDPRTATCRVRYTTSQHTTSTVPVTFDKLGLSPLDVLAMATAVAADPAASELDRRVLRAAFGDDPPHGADATTAYTISYAPDPGDDRATTRTFPELLDVAGALARVLGGTRPLTPADLATPENAAAATGAAGWATTEAHDRVQAAVDGLTKVRTDLGAAITAVPVPPLPALPVPTPDQADALREQLRNAAEYGIAAAYPAFVAGGQEGGVDPLSLLDQSRSVLADVTARTAAAAAAGSEEPARARAVFGRDFPFVAGFALPVATDTGAELAQAIANGPALLGGDAHAVDRWFTQVSRVREPLERWRDLRLLARASGARPAGWSLAQLPHRTDATWVGLPPPPDKPHAAGTLSLLLHAPTAPPDPAAGLYGLFLDDWTELIPNDREHAGLAFRHDHTSGAAPQTVLVAVSPTTASTWDLESVLAIVDETLDLAKIRAVDLEQVDALAQLVPTTFLAANAGADTIATSLGLLADPFIARLGGH